MKILIKYSVLFLLVAACSTPHTEKEKNTTPETKQTWEFPNERIVSIPISKSKEMALEKLAKFFDNTNHTQYNCGTNPYPKHVDNIIDTYNIMVFVLNDVEENLYFRTFSKKLNDTIQTREDFRIPIKSISFYNTEKDNLPSDFCTVIRLLLKSKFNNYSFDYYKESRVIERGSSWSLESKIVSSYAGYMNEVSIHLMNINDVERLHSIFKELLEE